MLLQGSRELKLDGMIGVVVRLDDSFGSLLLLVRVPSYRRVVVVLAVRLALSVRIRGVDVVDAASRQLRRSIESAEGVVEALRVTFEAFMRRAFGGRTSDQASHRRASLRDHS